MGKMNPKEANKGDPILSKAWSRIIKYFPSMEMAEKAKRFLAKSLSLNLWYERKELENLFLYLKDVDEAAKQLEKAGVPKQEIRKHLLRLHVTLIDATVKGMLLIRKCEEQEKKERTQKEKFKEA